MNQNQKLKLNRLLALLVFLLILPQENIRAQIVNVLRSQITWTSSGNVDLKTGNVFTREMRFVTFGNERIEVPNKVAAQIFKINSIDGAWTDLKQQGRLVYHVSMNDQQGIITLERTADGVYLTIDMTALSAEGIKRKFTIGQTEVNH